MSEMRFAEVIVDIPAQEVDRPFTYEIPPHLFSSINPGSVVLVPFGKRQQIGYVESLSSSTSLDSTLPIIDILEDTPVFGLEMVELCRWIADYYFSTRGEALKLALPPGRTRKITQKIVLKYELPDKARLLRDHGDSRSVSRSDDDRDPALAHTVDDDRQKKLVEVLESAGGGMATKELEKRFPQENLAPLLRLLQDQGLIDRKYCVVLPRVAPKWEEWCELEEIDESQGTPGSKQRKILAVLSQQGQAMLVRELLEITGSSRQSLKALERSGRVRLTKRELLRKPPVWQFSKSGSSFELTPEQEKAVSKIATSLQNERSHVFLLQGVTGSGKTEVYLRSIARVLETGKSAIVIVPEIVLTAQTVDRFRERFGDAVAVMHSGLSAGERFDQWRMISRGEYPVVVGTRSALFAPVKNLGLIVVDEEHETTYKQNRNPRYHAREVAVKRAAVNKAVVILGSATPSIESRYKCELGEYQLLELPYRVKDRPLPEIEIVDMRETERNQIFHPRLRAELDRATQAEDKVILFLNRRGFASFIMCRDCGLVLRCRQCAVSLTYHTKSSQEDRRLLKCHHCGSRMRCPDICPKCASHNIGHFGVGIQRVESETISLYPDYRVIRMDTDALETRSAYAHKLSEFEATPRGLLLGTQMIAKGLDFPEVTLVGVISADTALNLPDFRSAERTFQLMMQVGGRAGRGEKPGKVVLQTYAPEHYAIRSLEQGDYDSFYQQELDFRRELNYPPFSSLVNILVSGKKWEEVSEVAQALSRFLLEKEVSRWAELLGPTEAPIPRIKANYRWHMILKGRDEGLVGFLRSAISEFCKTKGKKSASIIVDVDPVWLL
jgi:primosomal protein N' (replication factor Y)